VTNLKRWELILLLFHFLNPGRKSRDFKNYKKSIKLERRLIPVFSNQKLSCKKYCYYYCFYYCMRRFRDLHFCIEMLQGHWTKNVVSHIGSYNWYC